MNENNDPLLSISGCFSLFAEMVPHFKCIVLCLLVHWDKGGRGAPPKGIHTV